MSLSTKIMTVVTLVLLICAAGLGWHVSRVQASLTQARSEIEELLEANRSLQSTLATITLAAQSLSMVSQAAASRKDELIDIMCPEITSVKTEYIFLDKPVQGEQLNEQQDRRMVDYWRGLFAPFDGVQ